MTCVQFLAGIIHAPSPGQSGLGSTDPPSTERTKKMKKNQKGFTLIELLIVVAIIGIIAAIAIPSLLRARVSANEAGTIGDIRSVISAQAAFQSAANGWYAPIACLNLPPPASSAIPRTPPRSLIPRSPRFLSRRRAATSARSSPGRSWPPCRRPSLASLTASATALLPSTAEPDRRPRVRWRCFGSRLPEHHWRGRVRRRAGARSRPARSSSSLQSRTPENKPRVHCDPGFCLLQGPLATPPRYNRTVLVMRSAQ